MQLFSGEEPPFTPSAGHRRSSGFRKPSVSVTVVDSFSANVLAPQVSSPTRARRSGAGISFGAAAAFTTGAAFLNPQMVAGPTLSVPHTAGAAPRRGSIGNNMNMEMSFASFGVSFRPKGPPAPQQPQQQQGQQSEPHEMMSMFGAPDRSSGPAVFGIGNGPGASKDIAQQEKDDQIYSQRQQFLIEQRRTQRSCHWATIVVTARFIVATLNGLKKTKAQARARDAMNPSCLLAIRRLIRRCRLSLMKRNMTRPTVASIRNDKMLGLFSEAHIQYLVDHLQPRYYFANEAIIFMGSEDDECFVLHSGSADVMMGKTKVFTMTAGMVFGSVGMISGEPRTATIVAREHCLVWYITRKVFESYGARDHQVVAAQTIIRELRQKNIRSVYKGLIDADYVLSKFSIFRGCSNEAVGILLAKSEPRVLKHGEVLQHPGGDESEQDRHQGNAQQVVSVVDNEVVFVLRGKVRVMRELEHDLPKEKVVEEHLTFLCDLAVKKHPGEDTDILRKAADEYERLARGPQAQKKVIHTREVIAELSGPMMINVAPTLLQEKSPIVVETVGGCDILVITRETFGRLPDNQIEIMKQNSLNIHCPFIKPLGRSALLRTIFNSSLSFDFLSRLQTECVRQEPFVYPPGTRLLFDARHDFVAVLILKGEIVVNNGQTACGEPSQPHLWPEIHLTAFGCEACEARCTTRVEVLQLRRSDILEAILNALNESQLDTFISALTTSFVSKVGRRPNMEINGVHLTKSGAQNRWKHLLTKSKDAARAAHPVHVVQPPQGTPTTSPRMVAMSPQSTSIGGYPNLGTSRVQFLEAGGGDAHALLDSSGAPARYGASMEEPSLQKGRSVVVVDDVPDGPASHNRKGKRKKRTSVSHGQQSPDDSFFTFQPGELFSVAQHDSNSSGKSESYSRNSSTNLGESTRDSHQQRYHQPQPPSARRPTTARQGLGASFLGSSQLGTSQRRPSTATSHSREKSYAQSSSTKGGKLHSTSHNTNYLFAQGPVVVQKATSGNVNMTYSAPSKGVSAKDKLHHELEDFFA